MPHSNSRSPNQREGKWEKRKLMNGLGSPHQASLEYSDKFIGLISILSHLLKGDSLNICNFPLLIKGRYQRSVT